MNINHNRLIYLLLTSFFLTSCGGGGSSSSTDPSDGVIEVESINVEIIPIEGVSFQDKNYVVTIDDKSSPLSNNSFSIGVEATPSNVSIATLATEFGEPILISYSNTNGKQIELSVESSADVFVMRSPKFYGLKIKDIDELSKRIRAHVSYPKLVKDLKRKIKNSPCPMDASCSALASNIAERIAQDINYLDLIH